MIGSQNETLKKKIDKKQIYHMPGVREPGNCLFTWASQRGVQETQLPDKIHYKLIDSQNTDDPKHQQKQEYQEYLNTPV